MANNILSNKNIYLLEGAGTPLASGVTGPTGSIYIDTTTGELHIATTAGSSAGWSGTGSLWIPGTTGTGSMTTLLGGNSATGDYSLAEGVGSTASGIASHAEGRGTIASGDYSHAEGSYYEGKSGPEGYTTASGFASHAEGTGTTASGSESHAEGFRTHSEGLRSHAEGWFAIASGQASHAEGFITEASGNNSHAEGGNTIASGSKSHAEGSGSDATGDTSHAEGRNTTASGQYSHSEGDVTVASGYASHAEGSGSGASGNYSHAEGTITVASGQASHSEGQSTVASGDWSHAEGRFSEATADYSHAEGSSTNASGNYSHAEGNNTSASAAASHSEGQNTVASGNYSHAEGYGSIASGAASHAGGDGSETYAATSFVHGYNNYLGVGATNSAMIGGTGLTGNSPNTTYVPSLEIQGGQGFLIGASGTLAAIDAASNRILVTKEWVQSATPGVSGATSQIAYFDSANSVTGNTNYTFDSGTLTLTVPNLIVGGTTTTVNSTVVSIEDPIFVIGGTGPQLVDDSKDRGIQFNYNNGATSKSGYFGFDESDSRFKFIPDATNSSEIISGAVGDVQFDNIWLAGATATSQLSHDVTVSRTWTLPDATGTISLLSDLAIGATVFNSTEGSVLFAGPTGSLQEDNNNLFWDDNNNRLGIGTSGPLADLSIVGSSAGTTVFSVDGTAGSLFNISDSLTGVLFSINNISGLPVLEVEDTDEVRLGNYLAPAGFTTNKVITGATGPYGIHNVDMNTYDMATFDYVVIGGTNYRAGNIQSVWDGSNFDFYETSTNDIGDTSPITFDFDIGNTAYGATATDITLVATTTSGTWTIKTIIKTI